MCLSLIFCKSVCLSVWQSFFAQLFNAKLLAKLISTHHLRFRFFFTSKARFPVFQSGSWIESFWLRSLSDKTLNHNIISVNVSNDSIFVVRLYKNLQIQILYLSNVIMIWKDLHLKRKFQFESNFVRFFHIRIA